MKNKFEISMFNSESICFKFKSIIICNKYIKDCLLNGELEMEVKEPYVIVTNNELTDEQIEILEDASIADCLKHIKSKPSFGGILV